MQCPNCQSHTTLKCEIAYEQGKSTSTVRGRDGSTGDVTTVSAFAQRAAPPSSWLKETGGAMVLAGIVWALLDDSRATRTSTAFTVAGWVAVVFAVLFVWRLLALPKYFRAHAKWQDRWICQSCGHTFHSNAGPSK